MQATQLGRTRAEKKTQELEVGDGEQVVITAIIMIRILITALNSILSTICECVFLWFCGQNLTQYHQCKNILAGP